jgi:signal peptidase I
VSRRERPAAGSRGTPGTDETVIDAFTPISRAPGDRARRPFDNAGRPPENGKRDTPGLEDFDASGTSGGTYRARPARRRLRRKRSFWRELPVLVVIAVVLALVIKTYAIQAFFIPSGSMQNTLQIGDRVLINKMVYHVRGIARGDIVVFDGDGSWDIATSSPPPNPLVRFWNALEGVAGITHGSDIYIKRIIGLPGDHVACCNTQGQVTVNGAPLSEQSYLYPGNVPSQQRFSIVVSPGRLWVMGDHREVSYDSRGHQGDPGGGTIPENAVIGRAFVIIWPLNRWSILNIPATFGQPTLTASAAAALDSAPPTAIEPAWSPLPIALGLGGAVPLTLLQRRMRRRVASRRSRRDG